MSPPPSLNLALIPPGSAKRLHPHEVRPRFCIGSFRHSSVKERSQALSRPKNKIWSVSTRPRCSVTASETSCGFRLRAELFNRPLRFCFRRRWGNAFLQVCEASLGRPEQQIAPTGAGTVEMSQCGMFLLGLEEGMNLGVQFAEASTRTTSPQPWCMPENGDAVQAARVLVKYIRANPETAHERTALLGLFAFAKRPCPAK